jgi:hypothetical protein
MRGTWTKVAGIVLIVLALVALGIWGWQRWTSRQMTVAVAAVEVPPNTILTEAMVKTGQVPAVEEHHYALSSADVVGKVTRGYLAPGQAIDTRGLMVAQLPEGARLLSTGEVWEKGYALVVVAGDPLQTTTGGALRPGDRVRVDTWKDQGKEGATSPVSPTIELVATRAMTIPVVPAANSPTGQPGMWIPGKVYTVLDIRDEKGLSRGLAEATAAGKFVLLAIPVEEVSEFEGLPVRLVPVLEGNP